MMYDDVSHSICGYIRVYMNRGKFAASAVREHVEEWARFVREDWGW